MDGGELEQRVIDVNSDVGELPDPLIDEQLLELISSANVACGGHAGDHASMVRVCRSAAERDVAVGAQISYPDRDGFGRRRLDIATDVLSASLAGQFHDLADAARSVSTRVHYIKPHGALYHAAIDDPRIADVIIGLAIDQRVPVLTMGFGELHRRANHAGIAVFHEAFLDRAYLPDGRLAPRDQPDAIMDESTAITRLATWARHHFNGAHSLCVHSDTPGAVGLARKARRTLVDLGLRIHPFVDVGDSS
jgi:UPF0271 protein